MLILLGTVFLASLLGSLHCVGMCGPFALLASSNPRGRSAAVVPTMAYSLGRLITYSVIGLIFGGLGMAINRGSAINQWQQTATYLAGGLMIGVGLIALARCFGVRIPLPTIVSPLQKFLQANFQRTIQLSPLPRALAIGMLTSLMPCGWLYTFGITAAGTGNPFSGMILMMVFWAGTVPIMTALMLGVSRIGSGLQQRIPLMMAMLVVLLGVFTIAFRAPVDLSGMTERARVVSDTATLTRQVNETDQATLPCCSEQQP